MYSFVAMSPFEISLGAAAKAKKALAKMSDDLQKGTFLAKLESGAETCRSSLTETK